MKKEKNQWLKASIGKKKEKKKEKVKAKKKRNLGIIWHKTLVSRSTIRK